MTLEEYVFSSCSYLPLFVQAPAPFNPNMIFGAGPVTKTLDLFLGSSINSSITFYTEGSLSAVKSLKLFLTGTGFPADATLPLVCYNDTITGTLPLFITGTGVTPNAIPVDNSLLLYIQCPFGASLPLYLMGGPQPSNNGRPVIIPRPMPNLQNQQNQQSQQNQPNQHPIQIPPSNGCNDEAISPNLVKPPQPPQLD